MTPEASVVDMLATEFSAVELNFSEEGFQLSQCRYFIQEACAQTYMATADNDDQIDVMQDVMFKLQEKHGKDILAATIFGSPLLGIKALREAITAEVIKRIEDDVNAHMSERLSAPENYADYVADDYRAASAI